MRYCWCLLLATVSAAMAEILPLTVNDISLMLRSGYTSTTIKQELATRHFADTLDEAKKKALLKAGATPDLIELLDNGTYAVPKENLEKLRRQIDDQEQKRALAAERGKKLETVYQNQLAKQRASAQVPSSRNVIGEIVKGNLVRYEGGNVVAYEDSLLERKKIYALYFSAHWCLPCRKFTPELVAYYNEVTGEHPELEVIFVSYDKTAQGMADYMRSAAMPWAAVEYEKLASVSSLQKYCGSGIPDLVIVDSTGKVLADSYVNGNYVGAARALDGLKALLGNSSNTIAASH